MGPKDEENAGRDEHFTIVAGTTTIAAQEMPRAEGARGGNLSLIPGMGAGGSVDGDVRLCRSDGSALVTVHPDGTVEFAEGFDESEAARSFWSALGGGHPVACWGRYVAACRALQEVVDEFVEKTNGAWNPGPMVTDLRQRYGGWEAHARRVGRWLDGIAKVPGKEEQE